MKQNFHLVSERVCQRIIEVIPELPKDGSLDIVVQDHKDDRTLAQLRLKWMWAGEYGSQHGITKDDANRQFKWRHCRPILIRDDETGAYKALFDRAEEDPIVARHFIDMIHSSDMSVKQFSEALTEWDHWAGSKGIIFPHPEDLFYAAMGL